MWELKYSKRKSAHPPDQARAAGAPPRLCPAWKGMRDARGTFDAGVGVITRCQGRLWSLEFIVHRAESADRCEKGYEKRSVQGLSKCHKTSLKTMKKLQIFKSFCLLFVKHPELWLQHVYVRVRAGSFFPVRPKTPTGIILNLWICQHVIHACRENPSQFSNASARWQCTPVDDTPQITAGLMVTADLLTESSLNAIYKRIGKLKENPWSLTSRSEKICSSSELLPLMMKHFSCDGSSDFFQDENPADHLWACGRVYAALSSSNTKKCENIPVEEWSSVEIRVNEERAPKLLWCHMLIDFCWLFL